MTEHHIIAVVTGAGRASARRLRFAARNGFQFALGASVEVSSRPRRIGRGCSDAGHTVDVTDERAVLALFRRRRQASSG